MTLYAIGDIQGCSSAFEALLERLAFSPSRDRLWLVGDLVNRGPDSLGVIRRVIALGDAATCVLGNHDLHLLAVVAGARELSANDTFADVLRARDADDLIDWLRQRPLLQRDDRSPPRVLVHAGIPPPWDLQQAETHAREVEGLLRGERWRSMLRTMYGNGPALWSPDLGQEERWRYTINALTRMRYCDRQGRLDLTHSGPPGSQPRHLTPWFDVADRHARSTHIIFGHWSALGLLTRPDVTGLDTGCVWGGTLTAAQLDPPGPIVSVKCAP
jgi:bis(5'-nucleosyl)-tetraphosphatase (symmetrical)